MTTNSFIKNLPKGNFVLDLVIPAVTDGNGSGLPFFSLPLYTRESIVEEELEGSAGVKLQYANVALQMEGESGLNDVTQHIRDGWLYIYINGYLWHEYQVKENFGFKDVDLRYWQTKDERKANSRYNRKIVFPTLLNSEETSVQIAYSEVQWSWSRICSLGGMNPEDPRLKHIVQNGETLSKIADQYSFIDNYHALADINGLSDAGQIKVGQQLKLRESDEPIGDADANRDARMGKSLKDQSLLGGDYSVVYVQDPLGTIEAFNTGLTLLLFNQQQMLAEMQGSFIPEGGSISEYNPISYPYLLSNSRPYKPARIPVAVPEQGWQRKDICNLTTIAQLSYATYLDENAIDNIEAPGKSEQEKADNKKDIQESLRETGDRLSKDDIETWLRVKERAEIRKEYREIQKSFIKLLTGEDDIYESFEFSTTLEAALEDFAWVGGAQYYLLWAKVADILNHAVIDPSTFDQQYDFKDVHEKERAEHQTVLNTGRGHVEAIYSGNHPMSPWLFPSQEQVDIASDQAPKVTVTEKITGPEFRIDDFQKAISEDPEKEATIDGEKNTMDFFNRFAKIVSALADNYNERPRTKECIEMLFRLAKGSGIPEVEGMHLVSKGEVLEGKLPLGSYRIEKVDRTRKENKKRNQRKFLAIESANNQKQRGWYNKITQIVDKDGKVLAANDIAFMQPWQGVDPDAMTNTDKGSIFEQYGKTGNDEVIVKASMDVWVVRADSKFNEAYRRASMASSHQLYSSAVNQLPRIMLLLEVIALKEVMSNYQLKQNWENRGKLVAQAINVIAAAIDVMDAWYGPNDAFIKRLASLEKYKSIRVAAKPIPLLRTGIYVPVIRWLGPLGNALGAGFTAYDSVKLLQAHDYDAAFVMGVAAVLGFAGAAVGLAGGAMAGTLGASASLMVPILGWAIFFVSLALIAAVEVWFKDTASERWATHSPFGKDADERLDHDDMNTIQQSLTHLQNLIMRPTAEVEKQLTNGLHRVTVTIRHPGFELNQSTLVFETTVQEMTLTQTAGMAPYLHKGESGKNIQPVRIENEIHGNAVQWTRLTYEFPEAVDVRSIYHSSTKDNKWQLKFRHILADGTSFPLNNSDFDQDKKSDLGWAILNWHTT